MCARPDIRNMTRKQIPMRPFEMTKSKAWFPELPAQFRTDYRLGNYASDRITRVMWKYLMRPLNCERSWLRLHQHMPELLSGPPKDILELSTAHGSLLEILRWKGHRVTGTDCAWAVNGSTAQVKSPRRHWHFCLLERLGSLRHDHPVAESVEGWPYQPLIESLGLGVTLHDGGRIPYPFADKSQDYVICYQAIEAYAPPERWVEIVDEMCRIARHAVVIGFNPPPLGMRSYHDSYRRFRDGWQRLMSYDRNGFQTRAFLVGQTRAGHHPTLCKLIAD